MPRWFGNRILTASRPWPTTDQSWLLFSESTSVQIDNDDIFVKSKANTRAKECYNSFYEDMEERGFLDELADSDAEDAEEHLMAYIDSKDATKH